MGRPLRLLGVAALVGVPCLVLALPWRTPRPTPSSRASVSAAPAPPPAGEPEPEGPTRALALPRGGPSRVSCRAARRVVAQARAQLAQEPQPVAASAFVAATAAWLDPHGLWSAAPDAPVRARLRRLGPSLLASLEQGEACGSDASGPALELGGALREWVDALRVEWQRGVEAGARLGAADALRLARERPFEDDPVQRPARRLAHLLGERTAGFERSLDASAAPLATDALSERYLPRLPAAAWAEVVLGAALRAYVSLLDVHGAWVPLDEESALYADDPSLLGAPRLWERHSRTAVGVVVEGVAPPLEEGDLVLEVGGIATAGLSLEQLEQLTQLESFGGETQRPVRLLRQGERRPRLVEVPLSPSSPPLGAPLALPTERIRYGAGEVAVVKLEQVSDDLGEALDETLTQLRQGPEPRGLLLDLRGNAGGSTAAATAVVGAFLPDAPCLPSIDRQGRVVVERCPAPASGVVWSGPLAVLVDGATASAAELIAGALGSYQRAQLLGAPTFGKGCIQETFDDAAGAGVLRLTTLIFALPDGRALQRVGLRPELPLPVRLLREREAAALGSPPAWTGPDIRDRRRPSGPAWPELAEPPGPCREPVVCQALRRLGDPLQRRPRLSRARPSAK